MIEPKKLKNNIVLLSEHIEEKRSCSIGFWFSVGSRMEGEGMRGISHLTEHMLFKGTKKRTTRDISCTFDRIGGFTNAYTERDDVCAYCLIPYTKENFELALSCLCDMSCSCVFPEEEFERELSVVKSEIVSSLDDSEDAAMDAVAERVWKDNALGLSITGTVDDVEKISRDMVMDWYDKHFVHGALTVSVAGRFDEDVLIRELEKLPVHAPSSAAVKTPDWHDGAYFVNSAFHQSQVYMLYPFPFPITKTSYYSLLILNSIVGDSMSSRLFDSLREKSALCYNVMSFFTFYEDTGLWGAYASCEKRNAPTVVNEIARVFRALLEGGVSDDEIADAKSHLCGEEIIGLEDVDYVMKRNQRNYALSLPMYGSDEVLEAIRGVTKDDITAIMKEMIVAARRVVVVFGPGAKQCRRSVLALDDKRRES